MWREAGGFIMRLARRAAFAAAILAMALPEASEGRPYVESMYSIQQVMAESEVIVEGVIEKADTETKTAVIKTGKIIKGKCLYPQIRMNIGVGQMWHPEAIMPHLVPGAPVLVFYNQGLQSQTYLNRFFFQLYGDAAATPEKAWWNLTHIEIRMNRTYYGTVPELTKLVKDILTGKVRPPAPDPKMPPISKEQVLELPPHPKPQDPAQLPPCFSKRAPDPRIYEKKSLRPDAEGFIRGWLVLGTIPLNDKVADPPDPAQKSYLERAWQLVQVKNPPKVFDKARIGANFYAWDPYETSDYYVDFGPAESSLCLAVAYLVCEKEEANLTLQTGSHDSVSVRLNSAEVIQTIGDRQVAKDQDKSKAVTLKKGINRLEVAVINGTGAAGACARFLDSEGRPFRGFVSAFSPTGVRK
jgi:hypothetical protein